MKKISLSIVVTLAFFVATAVAQSATAPGAGQGTTGSPTMSQPGGQQPGMTQPDNSTPMGQTDQNTGMTQEKSKGEKKLKGCVQSQGGQYVLETKHGKTVALTGQDVSAHVGHEVKVKGTWESGASAAASTGASAEKTFNVTNVDMVSDTCKGSKSNMGTSPSGTNPNTPPQ